MFFVKTKLVIFHFLIEFFFSGGLKKLKLKNGSIIKGRKLKAFDFKTLKLSTTIETVDS